MKKMILVLSVAVAACSLTSCGTTETKSDESVAEVQNEQKFDDTKMERDSEFAVAAASGGLMEVDLGNYAAANAASVQVKEFGKSMATDHSQGNEELKVLAQSKNISLPTLPTEKHQKMINDLKQKTGSDFDKAYMEMMVDDHKEDIDLFEKEADKGNDADLKAWAAGKVATLKHHLEMAENVHKGLK